VDAKVLAGEKIDPKTGNAMPVAPGQYSFFLGTDLIRLFNEFSPGPLDTIRIRLDEIVATKNNLKLYGFEFLERVSPTPQAKPNNSTPPPVDKDDNLNF
jgi:hypothetical protein